MPGKCLDIKLMFEKLQSMCSNITMSRQNSKNPFKFTCLAIPLWRNLSTHTVLIVPKWSPSAGQCSLAMQPLPWVVRDVLGILLMINTLQAGREDENRRLYRRWIGLWHAWDPQSHCRGCDLPIRRLLVVWFPSSWFCMQDDMQVSHQTSEFSGSIY